MGSTYVRRAESPIKGLHRTTSPLLPREDIEKRPRLGTREWVLTGHCLCLDIGFLGCRTVRKEFLVNDNLMTAV